MISISIVSMGDASNLIPCVNSLIENIRLSEYEIIVNAFNYSNEAMICVEELFKNKKYQYVKLQFSSGVRGYSANHNLNLIIAKYPIVCILNDDTYIKEDIFSTALSILESSEIAVCTPIIRNYDGSIQCLYRKRVSRLSYLLQSIKAYKLSSFFDVYENKNKIKELENKEYIEIPFCLGVCFIVKKSVLINGLLDETFFLGPDDLYWSYLIRKRNYCNKIVLACKSSIYHKGHSSISKYSSCAIPVQVKGMLKLFELMGFKGNKIFRLIFYKVVLFKYFLNRIMSLIGSNKSKNIAEGYHNTLKVYWRKNNLSSIYLSEI